MIPFLRQITSVRFLIEKLKQNVSESTPSMKGCLVEKNHTFFCGILKLPQFCFCPLQKVTYHFDQFQGAKFCIKIDLIIQI